MTFHPAQSASWEGKWGPQKGTANLQQALLLRFDLSKDFGIFNDRASRGSTAPSVHREGRAFDLGFPGLGHQQGYEALTVLRRHAWDLGLQRLIWDKRSYSARYPNGVAYNGVNPHRDHIHGEQTWQAARHTPLTLTRATDLLREEDDEMPLSMEEQAALTDLVAIRQQLADQGSSLSVLLAAMKLIRMMRKIDEITDGEDF